MKKQIILAATLLSLSSLIYAAPLTVSQLADIAANDNKTLPSMIDKETKLLSESVDPTAFHYHYQIIDIKAVDLDIAKFTPAMRDKLITVICADAGAKQIFASGLNISFDYVDKDNAAITSIEFKPSDCPAATPVITK